MTGKLLFLLLAYPWGHVFAWPQMRQEVQQKLSSYSILHQASQALSLNSSSINLRVRQDPVDESTCGYLDGNINNPRTAGPGFNCRFDTLHALWGFCPTTVIAATDCGLAGNCVDSYSCQSGCGITGNPEITTFSCTESGAQFCSSVLLTAGPDLVFSYIACGAAAVTQNLLAQPTQELLSSSKASSTSAIAASIVSTSTAPITHSKPTTSSFSVEITSSATLSVSQSTLPSSRVPPQSISTDSVDGMGSSVSIAYPTSQILNNSTSLRSDNLGTIVGAVIGGLAVICVFILGILFLRNQHSKRKVGIAKRTSWWKDGYRTTQMQTAGLHEKDADDPLQSKVDGRDSKYTNNSSLGSYGTASVGSVHHHAAYELPS